MAAEIAFEHLSRKPRMTVLDPMMGSGTTIAAAQHHGHRAIGYDMDPLAVLMSSVRCTHADLSLVATLGNRVVQEASDVAPKVEGRSAFPRGATDNESKSFIRYWFDLKNRKQLYALTEAIHGIVDGPEKNVLWCAFSRIIVKKKGGASLAMDVSHSRPHKVSHRSEAEAVSLCKESLSVLLSTLGSRDLSKLAKPSISKGDARSLPLRDNTIDLIITSPPYLNAIDYLRGHRLSLVWMGYSIPSLRSVRSNSIGSERAADSPPSAQIAQVADLMCSKRKYPSRLRNTLLRYLGDLDQSLGEMSRVLVQDGVAVVVIGNSATQGVFIRNSVAVDRIAAMHGFSLLESRMRRIPNNKRYLPTPAKGKGALALRMRTETVLVLQKREA